MKKYIKSITALNKLTLSTKNSDEIDRYAESDIFWAANKKKTVQNRFVKKGDIYQFEFGKNFVPEMSYEHRGLVIGISSKLLYVLPICSYDAELPEHRDVIHPIDNPESSSNYFLLKGKDYSFLSHDSVLKLNDLRSVSISRIKYKHKSGHISTSSATYRAIEYYAFSKHFPAYSYKYNKLKKQNDKLQKNVSFLQATLDDIIKMLEEHDTDATCREILQKVVDTCPSVTTSDPAKLPEKVLM